jgi:hypothetical protein
MIDHLEEDAIQIPSQRFACISIVSPTSNQKYNTCALKIRGVFATEEEGKRHAERLSKIDTTFDVFLVDMYKWLPIPPDANMIENTVYQDKVLNDIIQGHKEQQMLVKQHFEEQKKNAMNAPPPVVTTEEIEPDTQTPADSVDRELLN